MRRFQTRWMIRVILITLAAAIIPACKKHRTPTPNSPPSVLIGTPAGAVTGNITISYTLIDAETNQCSTTAQFSIDGGSSFATATPGPGGSGLVGLSSSPGGTSHTFVWDSLTDGVATGGIESAVQFRITPTDTATGSAGTTTNFTVNNTGNTAP